MSLEKSPPPLRLVTSSVQRDDNPHLLWFLGGFHEVICQRGQHSFWTVGRLNTFVFIINTYYEIFKWSVYSHCTKTECAQEAGREVTVIDTNSSTQLHPSRREVTVIAMNASTQLHPSRRVVTVIATNTSTQLHPRKGGSSLPSLAYNLTL